MFYIEGSGIVTTDTGKALRDADAFLVQEKCGFALTLSLVLTKDVTMKQIK